MVIGIDVGTSTTKIVGLQDGKVISPLCVKCSDPAAAAESAFEMFLHEGGIALADVEKVELTGTGSAYVKDPFMGIITERADEFRCNGLGARFLTGLDEMIVVSMGTGTSCVKCQGDDIHNYCGLAMGGGTLMGLSRMLLKTDDIEYLQELAAKGDIGNVNLHICDITTMPLPGLPPSTTASLLAKAESDTSREDAALGIIYTVLQTIGSAAVFASKGTGIKNLVFIGNLTQLQQCQQVLMPLEQLYGVRIIIPENAAFCTAIGAAI